MPFHKGPQLFLHELRGLPRFSGCAFDHQPSPDHVDYVVCLEI